MGPTSAITWKQIKDACQYLVKDQYGHDSPIQCIKEVRAFTNKGLKESKDLVDDVRSEVVPKGHSDPAMVYASFMRDELLREGYLILAGPGDKGADSVGSESWVHATTGPTSEVDMNVSATIHRHMTAQSLMIGRLLEAINEQNELLRDLVEAVG